jgi:integrase
MNNALSTTLVKQNPAVAYLATLRSEVGRRAMQSRLNAVARRLKQKSWRTVNWSTLNAANVQAIISGMSGAPATINTTLAAIRGVAKSAWRLGILDRETLEQIRDVAPVRGFRLATGRDVSINERRALLQACRVGDRHIDRRDAAMLALAMQTGMRREELTTLAVSDLRPEGDQIAVLVHGKGDKEREVYVSEGAARALALWLDVRGRDAGALFCYVTRGNRIVVDHHISTVAATKILKKRQKESGGRDVGWHDFRRTVAGDLMDAGVDMATTAALLGHSDVRTTQRYDRRPAATRKAAARKIDVPF